MRAILLRFNRTWRASAARIEYSFKIFTTFLYFDVKARALHVRLECRRSENKI